jgi:hypothetical protein
MIELACGVRLHRVARRTKSNKGFDPTGISLAFIVNLNGCGIVLRRVNPGVRFSNLKETTVESMESRKSNVEGYNRRQI